MNAMFLKELADKARRWLRGRIENGKAGGGLCYGYRVVRRFENGVVTTEDREIFEDRAGYFRETDNDQVKEKVDDQGRIIGFSILNVSALQSVPLEVALSS